MLVSLAALGAGPCDVIQGSEQQIVDAGPCGTEQCSDLLTVDVLRADNQEFVSGIYRFSIQLPGAEAVSIACTLTYAEQGLTCNQGNLDIMTATIDPEGQTLELMLLGAPEVATAQVKYNDWTIGERTLRPTYEELEPNGPDCPPLCLVGTAAMAVQPW